MDTAPLERLTDLGYPERLEIAKQLLAGILGDEEFLSRASADEEQRVAYALEVLDEPEQMAVSSLR